jgi:transcriptional regulator with XRE-family HTH domain
MQPVGEMEPSRDAVPDSRMLGDSLRQYGIGEKLRRLRLRKGLGLVELGRHTGLSPAMLSKLENGHVIPTLPTLLRISLVFAVGLDHFFTDDADCRKLAIVRKQDRLRFPELMGGKKPVYHFECLDYVGLDRRSTGYAADFEPMAAEEVTMHRHPGSEFIYVLTGVLGLTADGRELALEAGDSAYLDSNEEHGYRRIGTVPCTALVVTVP